MRKGLFTELAVTNIRAQHRLYIPYMLSCAGCIAMFYIMNFLKFNTGLRSMEGGGTLAFTLALGIIIIGLFSCVIVLYANSFLMKRRKKELGLYNILGMEKRHIARIMAKETVITAALCMIAGLGAGILFSKLMELLLYKIMGFTASIVFEVSLSAVLITAVLFCGIFLVALVFNVSRVRLAKPIELLHGSNVGEREPKAKWALALAGVLTLGGGYAIAVTTKSPSMAIGVFFIAVILVIIGTYCLFTAGSITLLKLRRADKAYYYKPEHFFNISGMLYRMKQNAVGLANICILSTMVLVMMSTTVCLYSGLDDSIATQYKHDIETRVYNLDDESSFSLIRTIDDAVTQSGVATGGRTAFRYASMYVALNGSELNRYDGRSTVKVVELYLVPLMDYIAATGDERTLGERGAFVATAGLDGAEALSASGEVTVLGEELSLEGTVAFDEFRNYNVEETGRITLVVQSMDEVKRLMALYSEDEGTELFYGIDAGDDAAVSELAGVIESAVSGFGAAREGEMHFSQSDRASAREQFLELYGGLFFLGLFLSLLFICAAVLIMYYRQVSEGYEDRQCFEIMQKVGMSRDEVRRTIGSQVLTVFYLPLMAAGIHTAFAFPLISVLFRIFSMTNTTLFALCTVAAFAVFALLYAAVYALTARTYYKIVSE